MHRDTLIANLRCASLKCAEHTRSMVSDEIPDNFLYLVLPNQSYDGNPLHEDEVVFPDETLSPGRLPPPRPPEEVADMLVRDGRVPEWIDVIRRVASGYTFTKLLCCGRFTANDQLLYYRDGPCPPFGIKGTVLPPRWRSVEADGKFSLNWREER
jgi:hypothetical protein